MKSVWLVIGETGDYSSRREWCVAAFRDSAAAEAFAGACRKEGEAANLEHRRNCTLWYKADQSANAGTDDAIGKWYVCGEGGSSDYQRWSEHQRGIRARLLAVDGYVEDAWRAKITLDRVALEIRAEPDGGYEYSVVEVEWRG